MFKKSESEPMRQEFDTPESSYTPERPVHTSRPKEPATIGPSIRIRGDLEGDEDLMLQGHVEGTVTLEHNLVTIGKEGKINATINARVIIIEGQVEGDLNADEQVTLKKSAGVRGNIVSPRVSLEDGCRFKGSIDMEGEAPPKSASIPKHNSGAKDNKVADFKSPSPGSEDAAKSAKGKPEEQQLLKS